MHRLARLIAIGAIGATILWLALTQIPIADSRTASPRGANDTAAELVACVRGLRAAKPALSYQAGLVRCVWPAHVETRSDVRWSTCKGDGALAPGERCETGSAHIELRATDADRDWHWQPREWPRWAERWHLYGKGRARCTRTIRGLPPGDPRARRTAAGPIDHVDFLMLWPAGSSGGAIAVGVYPGWSNWLKSARPDDAIEITAPACRPLVAALFSPGAVSLPPKARLRALALLDPAGVTVTGRRSYHGASRDLPAIFRTVGGPLVTRIDARTTATFELRARPFP